MGEAVSPRRQQTGDANKLARMHCHSRTHLWVCEIHFSKNLEKREPHAVHTSVHGKGYGHLARGPPKLGKNRSAGLPKTISRESAAVARCNPLQHIAIPDSESSRTLTI